MSSKKTGSKPAKEAENKLGLTKYDLWAQIIDHGFSVLKLLTWFGGISLVIFLLVTLPVKYAAGKQTGFSFAYEVITKVRLEFLVSTAAAAIFGILWGKERKLRKDDIERMHKQNKKLETLLDPKRSSSGLTERGDTPGDER